MLPHSCQRTIFQKVYSLCLETPCTNGACEHDGSCTVSGDTYVCQCQDGYSGPNCQGKFSFKLVNIYFTMTPKVHLVVIFQHFCAKYGQK